MGDYEQGWERKMPETIADTHGNDWDCVMTIPENQWGYHSDWKGHVKTGNELIEMLVKAVALDGNFVLNFDRMAKETSGRKKHALLQKWAHGWIKTAKLFTVADTWTGKSRIGGIIP